MAYILPSGGQVSFIYGFLVCVFCNLALAASLGELAALWPTAGMYLILRHAVVEGTDWNRWTVSFHVRFVYTSMEEINGVSPS